MTVLALIRMCCFRLSGTCVMPRAPFCSRRANSSGLCSRNLYGLPPTSTTNLFRRRDELSNALRSTSPPVWHRCESAVTVNQVDNSIGTSALRIALRTTCVLPFDRAKFLLSQRTRLGQGYRLVRHSNRHVRDHSDQTSRSDNPCYGVTV